VYDLNIISATSTHASTCNAAHVMSPAPWRPPVYPKAAGRAAAGRAEPRPQDRLTAGCEYSASRYIPGA
jgi:hypothetical protein